MPVVLPEQGRRGWPPSPRRGAGTTYSELYSPRSYWRAKQLSI